MKELFKQALAGLPHGAEFRFIDRLTSLIPGTEGSGEFRLQGDEAYLRGHFPGSPLLPGVLLVEAVAQLAGVIAQSDPQRTPLRGLKLCGIRAAKITGSACPGEVVSLHVKITGRMGGLLQAEGTAQVGGILILRCEVTLSGDVE